MAASFLGRPTRPVRPIHDTLLVACLALALAGCGGGGGGASSATAQGGGTGASGSGAGGSGSGSGSGSGGSGSGGGVAPVSRMSAYRLLTQATFGPTETSIAQVQKAGIAPWVDAQLAMPSSAAYLARWDADNQRAAAATPGATANATSIASQFYVQALGADDQLRQRVGFALSQIFVVSTVELKGFHSRAGAAYMDMLDRDAFGTYRALLQDVTLSPAMGQYLNMLRNQKGNPKTGQTPDQNFAREVMQLFSIGLSKLNADGSDQLDAGGKPVDTYTQADVEGLSAAFTGWSWGGPDTSNARFFGAKSAQDPNRMSLQMQAYPQFHATTEKRFLGTVVAAQATPDPAATLKAAMDTIAGNPNVGPFISRQLIQRLVTGNPSPAYVARVAAVFADDGHGVRGDLKAVVRAILLDAEARDDAKAASDATYGKIREPLLRLTAWMRAFHAASDSGLALVGLTDDPGLQLGQTVLRAPTVFNFYHPGHVEAGSLTGAQGLTEPELEITSETSVAGYVNYMAQAVAKGVGQKGLDGKASRPDVQPDYAPELAAAARSSSALVDDVTSRLLGDGVSSSFKAQIRAAVDSIAVPALAADGSNQSQVDAAQRNRVDAAVLLTLAAPEFIVQK